MIPIARVFRALPRQVRLVPIDTVLQSSDLVIKDLIRGLAQQPFACIIHLSMLRDLVLDSPEFVRLGHCRGGLTALLRSSCDYKRTQAAAL